MSLVIASVSRRITEAGVLIGLIGAAVIAWAEFSFIRAQEPDRLRERQGTLVGALLVALGFLTQLVGMLTAGKL
jgi:hypothetical protein